MRATSEYVNGQPTQSNVVPLRAAVASAAAKVNPESSSRFPESGTDKRRLTPR